MMGMTIGKLHKELEKLIKEGHARKPERGETVCVISGGCKEEQ